MISSKTSSETSDYIRLLVICCSISFIGYVAIQMRMPIVPLYARSLHVETALIGIINSAFFLLAGILSIPMGIVSDRIGRKQTACFGLIVLAGASFLLCISTTFIHLCSISLLIGAGVAAFGPTMMSFVADISPPTHLGRSYGWYTTAVFTGMSFGPGIGGFIAQSQGFIPVFIISGILLGICLCVTLFFFPGQKTSGSKKIKPDRTSFFEVVKNLPYLACLMATLGGTFGLGMFLTFAPLHSQNQGLSVKDIGVIFMIQGLFNGISRIPFGQLSDSVSDRKYLVMIGLAGFAASISGIGWSRNMIQFLIFAALFGASMGLAFTSIGALISQKVHPSFRGVAMGGYNTCIYLGMMSSSALMGSLIQKIGFTNGFYVSGAVIVCFLTLFYLLYRKSA